MITSIIIISRVSSIVAKQIHTTEKRMVILKLFAKKMVNSVRLFLNTLTHTYIGVH